MRPSRGGVHKKSKTMDYTNYAYNEAVGRLKMMLADSYTAPKTNTTCSYLRSFNDDSADNYSDNMSTIDRPVFADISKYLSPSQKSRLGGGSYRPKKTLSGFSASKENLTSPARQYQTTVLPTAAVSSSGAVDYYASTPKAQMPPTDSVQAPVEIFNFIEKQEDYIEQLEKESKYCRNELSNLLGKVKDVINENEQLTEHARSELNNLGKSEKITTSPSSDSDDILYTNKKTSTPRKKEVKSPRYASAPNIVYEARISELEAELMQANIDLKRVKTENDDLKKKLARSDISTSSNSALNCEAHRKQIELLQKDKTTLEETIRQLHKSLDEAKSQQYSQSSKRYINDLVQMERSQAELEVRHLRDELDRQHERVRELQHEMARRLADERANAERRYNNQVDQLGGDLSSQWEQVAKLQLDLERQKRYENDLKRDLANRNSQIEELKMELRANRSTFLADMAQVNAEKQSLEQEITALRLQLDRASRENKTEAARLNAEINSLRQRLDRADADLLHSKREVLRLNDEIANLEKELAYGEMKNEIRPTKKDLDKRISEMQEKHAETVNELEEMIQSQKQLMDKLTNECKTLTNKLEDTTLKHKTEISSLQSNVEYLTNRMLNSDRLGKLDNTPTSYNSLPSTAGKASLDYKPSTFGTTNNDPPRSITDDYSSSKTNPYSYDSILGKTTAGDTNTTTAMPTSTTASYDNDYKSKYESPNSAYDYKTSTTINDNDDENLKDNIGEGEKKQQHQQQPRDSNVGDSNTNANDTAGDYATTGEIPDATNVADYSAADYSGYEGYDQQQYDATAYDPSYDQSQYGGESAQYDGTGQGYDTTAYDYNATDYDATTYQYDTSGGQQPQAAEPTTPVTSAPATAAPVPTPVANTGPSSGSTGATEGRAQSRTSSGPVGPTTATGGVSSTKPPLPQQSSTPATKK
ncbi:kinesin-related protein 4 isoform X3 [Lucilia cuprina]|uniref:kinesin-related protein 4 isoform X3 n=1 Tax=Lucilia cuprina TaxID=7375 RepID=UPI001F064ACB|nr:kinesin-related protein 4 isoform X3 [Lucilia cuprina]